jgi:hypothetical protein
MMRRRWGESGIRRLGLWGWFAVVALLGLLAAAVAYAIHAWRMLAGVAIPPTGWVFLVLGVTMTLTVGAGLMALLFYSNRKGKDF